MQFFKLFKIKKQGYEKLKILKIWGLGEEDEVYFSF